MYTLQQIKNRLALHEPIYLEIDGNIRQAAVAIVIREHSGQCEILFIKRATTPGDPWSGHMAFPGGHRDSTDATLQYAAIRETHEETGLELQPTNFLGALSHQRAAPRGRVLNMLIAPFVFGICGEPTFSPNHEVDDIVWGSLPDMFNGSNHDTEQFMAGDIPTRFSGYRLKPQRFVWGLTYRTLQTFFKVLDESYSEPLESH